LGHALGLQHAEAGTHAAPVQEDSLLSNHGDPPCLSEGAPGSAVMCKFIDPTRAQRNLQPDDLAGLYNLYPPVVTDEIVLQRPGGLFQSNSIFEHTPYVPVSVAGHAPRVFAAGYQHHWAGTFIGDQGWQASSDIHSYGDVAQYGDSYFVNMSICNSCGFVFPFFVQDTASFQVIKNGVVVDSGSETAPALTGFPEVRVGLTY
jgi:hypothetical protein